MIYWPFHQSFRKFCINHVLQSSCQRGLGPTLNCFCVCVCVKSRKSDWVVHFKVCKITHPRPFIAWGVPLGLNLVRNSRFYLVRNTQFLKKPNHCDEIRPPYSFLLVMKRRIWSKVSRLLRVRIWFVHGGNKSAPRHCPSCCVEILCWYVALCYGRPPNKVFAGPDY